MQRRAKTALLRLRAGPLPRALFDRLQSTASDEMRVTTRLV